MPARSVELADAQLPALFDGLDVGVIVQGADSEILYANQMALHLLGLRRDQVLGVTSFDPSWDVIRPDGTPFPPHERPVARVLATGAPVLDVVLGVRRGGPERSWILANARPHQKSDGRVAHVVITLSDISSERRRMNLLQQVKDDLEQAVEQRTTELARSRAAFQQVTDAVPGVLYQMIRAEDGAVSMRFVSAHVREMFGLTVEQAQADVEAIMSRFAPEDRRVAELSLRQAERARSIWECDIRLRDPQGQWRWVRNRAVPQPVEHGTLWSGVVVDVTKERELADQVRVSQTREAIGSVTAGIAHNFNNALAVIVPNLEDAIEDVEPEVREPLQESLQTALSAASLVKQLMLIARDDAGEQHEPVDVASIVRDVTKLCQRLFQGRIAIQEQLPAESVRVMAQAASLRQVLLNICINAREALQGMEHGRVEVSVQVEQRQVHIRIRDNGPGMNQATLRRLGEPFFTTKGPQRGTGLGLATAYATVRSLRGTITCDSAPGRGAAFTIALPVHDFGQARPAAPPPARTPAPRPRGRVLVVDDEALVRRAVGNALRKRGFAVDEAEDGASALRTVEAASEPYQLVVLDLSMPGISGERVLEQLRQSHPTLPVVILSGFIEDPARVASANAVLTKPASSRSLMATIEQILH